MRSTSDEKLRRRDTLPLMRRVTTILWMLPLLGGCSNPFMTHYQGDRCPVVPTAHVATQTPANATLIGTSNFRSDVAVGDAEALGAARAVGANIVQWDRAFLRDDVVLERTPTLAGGMSEVSTMAAEPEAGTWFRIHARFWRSNALGSLPSATATATPADPPPASPAIEPSSASPSESKS